MIEKIYILLIFIVIGLSSCVYDDIPINIDPDLEDTENYLQIKINLPELEQYNMSNSSTRSMGDEAEREIKLEDLSVLAFKQVKNDQGVFEEILEYKAGIYGDITYDDNNSSLAKITVKVQRSKSDTDKYRFVLIANHNLTGATVGESKGVILQQIVYKVDGVDGKWNADTGYYKPFPMWGETEVVTVSENLKFNTVDMYRALARVDVGIKFDTTAGNKLKEEGMGLEYFKIKEVNVYRTNDRGYVAPLSTDLTKAYVPSNVKVRDDESPLQYKVDAAAGANEYVREIYIPEVVVSDPANNDNVSCMVVGGYYGESKTVTYYRMDFATEENGIDSRVYLPILRNHRYVFNITDVHGPGFASTEEALKSTGSMIDYDVIVWDDLISNVEVNGKYYFGLDQRDILFGPEKDLKHDIVFQTNLPLEEEYIALEWSKGDNSPFKVDVTKTETVKKIHITTKDINQTNTVLEDILTVKMGPFSFPVVVKQDYVNFKYVIECSKVTVNGKYIIGKPLIKEGDNANTISLELKAEDQNIINQGQEYEITTDTIDGIWFSAKGKFTSLEQEVTLQGHGTLTTTDITNGSKYIRFTIKSNSSASSFCEATVVAVSDEITMVTITGGDLHLYGYDPGFTDGGTNKVYSHTNNFGPFDHSIVKIKGLNYVRTKNNDFSDKSRSDQAYNLVTGKDGKYADIVYIAYDWKALSGAALKETANVFINYMKHGGVIIGLFDAFNLNEELIAKELFSQMFSNKTIGVQRNLLSRVYPFPANDAYLTKTANDDRIKEKHELLAKYEGDPILNGPFGDVRDKQWGDDVGATTSVSGLPTESDDKSMTIYSYLTDISKSSYDASKKDKVTSFKYESDELNLVFFGDGGLTSSFGGAPNSISLTECPFVWDPNSGFPISKSRFGAPNSKTVYNSTVACNMMSWAIDRSLDLKSKRDANAKNKSNE